MTLEDAIENIIDNAKVSEDAGDYVKGGLIMCGSCHTPRQTVVNIFGRERTVGCLCKCRTEKRDAEERRRADEARRQYFERLPANRLQDRTIQNCTFENAKPTPMIDRAKRYVNKWQEMYEENIGLVFWGNTGNGKTYTAACIANALMETGVPVLVTGFPKILAALSGMFSEDKNDYLNSLSAYKLLVIDDLGAERQSEYALEQVYSVIDQRYKAKLPIIITTNLTMDEMKNPKNMDYQRIYDRVLEMCVPLHFAGESMRKADASAKLEKARRLLTQ